jgi:hypothetical protein
MTDLLNYNKQGLEHYVQQKLKDIYPQEDHICNIEWSVINYGNTYVQSDDCIGPSWVVEPCYKGDSNKHSEEDCIYVLIHKIDSNNVIYDTLRFDSPLEASIALEWLISGGF